MIIIEQDRANHKESLTWLLTQRIGPMDLEKLIIDDDVPRIFYDKEFVLDDGRVYKGEW